MTIASGSGGPAPIRAVPVRRPWRWVGAAVIALLGAMLIHSMAVQPGWQWSYFKKYLFNHQILHGAVVTIELTAVAMAIGVVGGIVLAVMRLSANAIVSSASALYIWFFRGTPVLVQIVIWFNLSSLFPHLSIGIPFGPEFATADTNSLITKFMAAALGLGLNEAAYMAEIVRAGILSVDEGQIEAAGALGMPSALITRRIVLPQAMRVIIPPTGNEAISMLKTSSIVIYIALTELFTATQNIINTTYATIPLLFVACFWYLVMTTVLTVGQVQLERRFGRGSSRNAPPDTFFNRFLAFVGARRGSRTPQVPQALGRPR